MKLSNLKRRLAQTTIIAGLISLSATPFALAQDADEEEARQDTVLVTGSRIARTDLLAASPVTTVDAQSLDIAGATNVQDILNELPATGVPALTDTNSNFTLNGGGVNLVNLRNLGLVRNSPSARVMLCFMVGSLILGIFGQRIEKSPKLTPLTHRLALLDHFSFLICR